MKIKNFSLDGTNNLKFQLSDYVGKKLVIYFYPKDSTPGCTNEGIDFSNNHDFFKTKNCEIFGISRDSIKSHENFKAKYNFSFELLADTEELACNIFDVIKMKNMYGKQVRGIERSTFIIDENGNIIKEWRGVKVKDHVEEVINFLNT